MLFLLLVELVSSTDPTLGTLVALVLFLPSLSVTIRRLHDTDRSAWSLLVVVIPVIGVLLLLWYLVQAGTVGSNRFGPPTALTAGPRPTGGGLAERLGGGDPGPGRTGATGGPWDAPPPPPPSLR